MKNRKGFTLAELLAVLVILAVLITIATPAVVKVMNSSKENAFYEYAQSIIAKTNNKVISDLSSDTSDTLCYAYDITTDLGLTSTGDYKGYILYVKETDTYHLTLYDNKTMLIDYTFTSEGSNNQTIDALKEAKVSYSKSKVDEINEKLEAASDKTSTEKIIYLFGLQSSCNAS